ncbi:MAG: hypothetical protein DRH90_22700, partial [Deltaproteobacteria bacterium]
EAEALAFVAIDPPTVEMQYVEELYQDDWATFPVWNPSFGQSPKEETLLETVTLVGLAGLKYVDRLPYSTATLTWDVEPAAVRDTCAFMSIGYRKVDGMQSRELIQIDGDLNTWTHEYLTSDTEYGEGYYIVTPISNLGYRGKSREVRVGYITDTTAPDPVINFQGVLDTIGGTRLTWDANTEVDLGKYNIFVAVPPGDFASAVFHTSVWYEDVLFISDYNVEASWYITAQDTSSNESAEVLAEVTYPTPAQVQNFHLNVADAVGLLTWDLLDDEYVNQYQVFYNPDPNALSSTDPGTVALVEVDGKTNSAAVDAITGAYFIFAKNIFGNLGPEARTSTLFDTSIIDPGSVGYTQELIYIERYPFNELNILWAVTPEYTEAREFQVWFIKSDLSEVLLGTVESAPFLTQIEPLAVDDTWHSGTIEVRPVSYFGTVGAGEQAAFTLLFDSTPPSQVQQFTASVVNNWLEISWSPSISEDVANYQIYYNPDIDSAPVVPLLENAVPVATASHDTVWMTVPRRLGTYIIVVEDTSGNMSAAVDAITTVQETDELQLAHTADDGVTWPGTLSNFVLNGDYIDQSGTHSPGTEDLKPLLSSTYTFLETIGMTNIYEARLEAKIKAKALTSGGYANSEKWDVWMEYRTGTDGAVIADWPTLDDPIADPIEQAYPSTWTDWRRFTVVDTVGQYFEFRVVAKSKDTGVTVQVQKALVNIYMVARQWNSGVVSIPAGGTDVYFDPAFAFTPTVTASLSTTDPQPTVSTQASSVQTVKVTSVTSEKCTVNVWQDGLSQSGAVNIIAIGFGKVRPSPF